METARSLEPRLRVGRTAALLGFTLKALSGLVWLGDDATRHALSSAIGSVAFALMVVGGGMVASAKGRNLLLGAILGVFATLLADRRIMDDEQGKFPNSASLIF